MLSDLKPALRLLLVLTLLIGGVYPVMVTGLARVFYPAEAVGSLIEGEDGRLLGSSLIGQRFVQPGYFHSRPSAVDYDAGRSGGSNLSPAGRRFVTLVTARAAAYRADNLASKAPLVPLELVTASGSGLDPHVSPAGALYQVPRVARVRGMGVEHLQMLVGLLVEGRTLGFLGEPRVNLLKLNLALDEMTKAQPPVAGENTPRR